MKCEVCGKEFTSESGRGKYCEECKEEKHREQMKEWYRTKYHRKPEYKLQCVICGKEIIAKRPTKKYCDECKSHKNDKDAGAVLFVECKDCGKVFMTRSKGKKYCTECLVKRKKAQKEKYLKERDKGKEENTGLYCAGCGKPITRSYKKNVGKSIVFCGCPNSTLKEDDCVMRYWGALHKRYRTKKEESKNG